MTAAEPVRRFLADVDASQGPFALLGLAPGPVDSLRIDEALARQLARVAAHPMSPSPEGDEVRQALHVAAAQLKDPAVRDALLRESALRTSPTPALPPPAAPARVVAPDPAPNPALDRALLAAIASSGGWNRDARRRVVAAARATRSELPHIAASLARLGLGASALRAARAATITQASTVSSMQEPAITPSARRSAVGRVLRAGAMLLMVLSTFLMARAIVLVQPRPVPRSEAPAADAPPQVTAHPGLPAPTEIASADAAPGGPLASSGASPRAVVEPAPNVHERPDLAQPGNLKPAPVARRSGGALTRWEAAALAILREPAPSSPWQRLALSVRLARLSAGAQAAWAGDATNADAWVRAAESSAQIPVEPVETANADADLRARALTSPGREGDGQLALQISAARRQPGGAVEAIIRRRAGAERLGPVDCDAVAEAAYFGSPLDLRLACKRTASEQGDNPAMLHALLEALPRAAAQPHVSELIESVTGARLSSTLDPSWPARARAALVRALIARLGESSQESADQLASLLALAYAGGAPAHTSDVAPGATEGAAPDPSPALEAQWRRWRDQAITDRTTAAEVEAVSRRRELRLGLAQGPAQRVVASRASLAELMALVVEREQPSLSLGVGDLLTTARTAQRTSDHVYAQIAAWERAIVRLWLLRAGSPEAREPAPGSQG